MKRFIYSGTVCVATLLVMAVPDAVGQAPVAPVGTKYEARRPRQPGGVIRDRLGEYLTIEGVLFKEGKVETNTLLVDTVDGEKLDKPVTVLIRNVRGYLPADQRCVLKGYELGEMIGTPPAVVSAAKEQGRTDVAPSQAVWRWRPYFVVLIPVEPKGLEISKE